MIKSGARTGSKQRWDQRVLGVERNGVFQGAGSNQEVHPSPRRGDPPLVIAISLHLPPRAQPKVAARARVMSRDGCARRARRPRSPNFFIIGKGKLINGAQRGFFYSFVLVLVLVQTGSGACGPSYRSALISSAPTLIASLHDAGIPASSLRGDSSVSGTVEHV